jgi:hypothetical protein
MKIVYTTLSCHVCGGNITLREEFETNSEAEAVQMHTQYLSEEIRNFSRLHSIHQFVQCPHPVGDEYYEL